MSQNNKKIKIYIQTFYPNLMIIFFSFKSCLYAVKKGKTKEEANFSSLVLSKNLAYLCVYIYIYMYTYTYINLKIIPEVRTI